MLAPGTESVLALVSGLAPGARERRLLLMLQAYFDESGTNGPVLVLAGFLASTEQWLEFSSEWKAVLDLNPSIEYLKMNEAAGLNGQFLGWSKSRRDERMALFFGVIERHIPVALYATMPREPFSRIFAPVAQHHTIYRNPYYLLMIDMMSQFSKNKDKLGLTEKVDFIFDEGAAQKSKIIEFWEFIESSDADPRLKAIIGDMPTFKDDKLVLPLQAADIHAWFRRRRIEEDVTGKPPIEFSFKVKKPMQSLSFEWTEQKLLSTYRNFFFEGIPTEVLLKFGLLPLA